MKQIKHILPIIIIALFILMPSIDAIAQCGPGPTGEENGNPCCVFNFPGCICPVCTPVPLDGGLSALLFAGLAFGAKKVMGKSKV
jgi:hypothetical protein